MPKPSPITAAASELTGQVVSRLVGLGADDLPELASVHDLMAQLASQLQDASAQEVPALGQLIAMSAQGSRIVEEVILREATDATAALRQATQTIADMQAILNDVHNPDTTMTGGMPASGTDGDTGNAKVDPQPSAIDANVQNVHSSSDFAPVQTDATTPSLPLYPPVTPPVPTPLKTQFTAETLNSDDLPLISEFVGEANGHIDAAEAGLLALEENPHDIETVNAIFRSFHTIKGVAGLLNMRQIGALAHAAENLLDLARKEELTLAGAVVDVVLQSIDLMKAMIADVDAATRSGQPLTVQAGLPGLIEDLRAAAEGQPPEGLDAIPTTQSPQGTPGSVDQDVNPPRVDLEVNTSALDAKVNSAAGNSAAPSSKANTSAANTAPAPGSEATVKVTTQRLDKLINMVGELVIAQSMVVQDVVTIATGNPRIARNASHLGKISRELQELAMSMRMVPIQGVFQKMARLVRDLARKATKDVELITVGGETELDRNVVEAISDPLVHMVRNSVDHGIEAGEARVAAGKPRVGKVELRACHEGGNIVIQIKDDGQGLRKQRILNKAIAAGVVKPGQELSEAEILRLVFHPGLSTAEKITDISGRGVGMDVVRKNVEALRGQIDITSAEGQGSTFTIRLPLTLAVIDGQIVRIGTHRYIVPITSIEESLRPKANQLSTVQGRGEQCLLRDRLLPLVRLHKLFKVTPQEQDPTKALVVVVQDAQRRCCLLVDELLGQQQVVIKSLGEGIGAIKGVSGGAILGDGSISLILDVPGLVQLAMNTDAV